MIIALEVPNMTDIDLVYDVEPVLGQAVPPEDRQSGLFRAGAIFTRPLTPESAVASGDKELASFIEDEAKAFDYHIIRIVCTFLDRSEERFESAWIKVDLTRSDDDDNVDSQPVAWSVEPERLSQPSGLVHNLQITVPAKLVTATYGRQVTAGEEVYMYTKFVGSNRPTWYLKRTRNHIIDGDADLRIIVRVPHGVTACAELSIGGAVQRKIGKIIPRVADLPNSSPLRRTCFGDA